MEKCVSGGVTTTTVTETIEQPKMKRTFLSTAWFWSLILSIILLMICFILVQALSDVNNGKIEVPWWTWILFGLSIFLWILALILYFIDVIIHRKTVRMTTVTSSPSKVVDRSKTPMEIYISDKDQAFQEASLGNEHKKKTYENLISLVPTNEDNPRTVIRQKKVIIK